MGTMLLPLLLGVCLSIPVSMAATYTHRDVIQENGTRFVQRTEVDVKGGLVLFHVPAHNGLTELKELYDFNTGRVLRCEPAKGACFLARFNRKKYGTPATLEKNFRRFEKKHRSARREERREKTVNENLVVVDAKPADTAGLSARMRRMLGKLKLYREVHLKKGIKIIQDSGIPLVASNRTKRGTYGGRCSHIYWKCRYNRSPIWAAVPTSTSTRSCERTYYCNRYGCHWKHLTHNNYYRCCCCQEHSNSQQCYRTWGSCSYQYYYG